MPIELGKDDKGCFARWGGTGHKYYYTCGNDKELNEAKHKAYIQGYTIGDLKNKNFLEKQENIRYTLGIVYESHIRNEILSDSKLTDAHGDFCTEETIETACWEFMKHIQKKRKISKQALNILEDMRDFLIKDDRTIELDLDEIEKSLEPNYSLGIGHNYWDESLGDIVECYITRCDQDINGEKIKKGSWILGVIWNEDIFQDILDGKINGYSFGGLGVREKINNE